MKQRPTPDGEGRRQLPNRPPPTLVVGTDTHPATQCRTAATGVHAQHLHEAAQRLDTVSQLLAAAALEHVAVGDLADCLPSLVKLVDCAARHVTQAGEP